jgi:hypothetical protein
MPGVHKNPLLGWRPPAELSAWARAEAERRGVGVGVILTEALEAYREAASLPCPDCFCGVPPGTEHKPRCTVARLVVTGMVPQVIWTPPATLDGLLDLSYARGLEDAQ